jgi:Putative beta barrel porin-7 (BBP7)
MSKGVLATVAALAASAGMAFGQGAPPTAPQAFPNWGGAAMPPAPGMAPVPGMAPAPGSPMSMSTPGGMPAGVPGMVPPAAPYEMPHNGVIGGQVPYPGFQPTFGGDQGVPPQDGPPQGGPPQGGWYDGAGMNPQVHKAAGGPDKFWIDVEHIAWKVRSMPIPFPLVVASPPAAGGVLGQEGTRVLFGDENVDYGSYFNVLRLTGGFWCGCDRNCGLELSGFIQEARSEVADFHVPITGRQVLARPLIDALTGQASSVLVAFPGQFGGDVFVNARLKMGGAEANLLKSCVYCDRFKFNVLGGVRYIDHDETLTITSRSTIPALDPTDPTLVDIFDEFACRNQFFGGQLGFEMELRHRRCFMDITGKVALGNQNENLNVRGFTNNRTLGVNSTTPGGMLALAGNITDTNDNEFAYVPEVTIKLGYQWTQRISTFVGYNGLYISRLMRPGDQIDPVINPVFLPVSTQFGGDFGPVRPINTFNKTDFWTQGVTFGLSIRY